MIDAPPVMGPNEGMKGAIGFPEFFIAKCAKQSEAMGRTRFDIFSPPWRAGRNVVHGSTDVVRRVAICHLMLRFVALGSAFARGPSRFPYPKFA